MLTLHVDDVFVTGTRQSWEEQFHPKLKCAVCNQFSSFGRWCGFNFISEKYVCQGGPWACACARYKH